jgi:hypothetical protein
MGLSFKIIWFDDDVLEVRVSCENGRFSGTADCYIGHSGFTDLAATIKGFPSSNKDRREFELGTFNPGCAGGGVRIQLWCIDASGHVVADIRIRSAPEAHRNSKEESAELSFRVEPAAIDEFVAALRGIQTVVDASVALQHTT